jgi:hypothetical protein
MIFSLYLTKVMAWNDFLTKLIAKKKHSSQQKKRIWTILLIVLPFLLGLVLYSLTQVKEVAAQWWDETWLYRRVIEISNSNAEELTDFQVSLTIDTATLIADGKMQSNCGDLRITDWDGIFYPIGLKRATLDVIIPIPKFG